MQLQQQDTASPIVPPVVSPALRAFPDPTWTVGPTGRLVGLNTAAERTFGLSAAAVQGRDPLEVLGRSALTAGAVQLGTAEVPAVRGSLAVWPDGDLRHASLRVATGSSGVVSRHVLESLLEHVSDAIITVDVEGLVSSLNKGAETMYGVRAEDAVGRHVDGLTRSEGADEYLAAMRDVLVSGAAWRGVELELTTLAGRTLLVDSAATALLDDVGAYVGAILVSRDVTPVRELEQSLRAATRALRDRATQIARATHRDALTGVAARSLLQERLAAALSAAAEGDEPVCVLAADLDGFRAVNDSYGLATGDAVLIAFAAHLREALPPSATAGRLGADEFAVVLPGTDEEEAGRIARLVRAWTPPSPLPSRGRRVADPDVGVTVGVVRATSLECRSPFDSGVRSVLQRAEDAVAQGKQRS